tara:strand:- start:539 stop:1036 length:498 start_codon:yes stop_codon:yes gene_type:complete
MELIQLNRDPKINEFSKENLVLNTVTGDLFAKTNTKLFRIFVGNISSTVNGVSTQGSNIVDGFYGILTSIPLVGSNVSLHGGLTINYGQPLPNSPYIKTNGGFDILMDNANTYTNSSFRIFKDTALAGVSPGVELLKVDNDGNLIVKGSISGSGTANTDINGGSF